MTQDHLAEVLGTCPYTKRRIGAGEVLMREGEPGSTFYLVRSGRLRAVRSMGTPDADIVGEIGPDEPIGEMAVLGLGVHSASVVALRDSLLLEFRGDLIDDLPLATMVDVMRTLAERLQRSMADSAYGPRLPSTLTIVPINDQVPLTEYVRHLHQSLEYTGRTCRTITQHEAPHAIVPDEGGSDAFTEWVEEREDEHDMVFLQADFELTPWTRACLRNCDGIILLGMTGTDPTPGETERVIARMQDGIACPNVYLVLVHEAKPFTGTDRWLAPRDVVRHFHIRLDSETDRRRAARLLTGSDVSVALGGGGARGFAHIGILRALEELEIPVDRIGGTSMGAIIAALRAREMGWEAIRETVRAHFVDGGPLSQLTLPVLSIDTGKRYVRMLERMFGDRRIEDLPLNYYCVSCNLTRAESVVHRRGPLAKWIGASVSVPGIAPPLVVDGELHVDGGLLNNLPVDVVKTKGAGTVIGVDVSPDTDLRMTDGYSGRPQAMEIIRDHIVGGHDPDLGYPTLGNVLVRATCLTSIAQKDELMKMADLYIKVPVGQFKMLEWNHLDELVEIGYRTGMEQLAPLRETLGTVPSRR